jgi:photosystem II stability/assembly factor-like uncharacterized protein
MSPQIYIGTVGMSVWESSDLGQTLTQHRGASGLYGESRVWSLASAPSDPDEIIAGTDSGIYIYSRSTGAYSHQPSPMDEMQVWTLAQSPSNPDLVLAGTRPGSIFRSFDRGRTWTELATGWPRKAPYVILSRVTQIVFDQHDPEFVLASLEIGGIWRSRDSGQSWEKCVNGMVTEDGHGVAIVHNDPRRRLLATTANGLHISDDDGDNWSLQQLDTPWEYTRGIFSLPGFAGTLFMGHGDTVPGAKGMLLRSQDYGDSWQDVGLPGEPGSTIWCITASLEDPRLVLASTFFGRYYLSKDGGSTWKKLQRELGETRSLLVLPEATPI